MIGKNFFEIYHNTTPAVKKIHPFAFVGSEIGVKILSANITHIKSHAIALGFWLQTDMNQIS